MVSEQFNIIELSTFYIWCEDLLARVQTTKIYINWLFSFHMNCEIQKSCSWYIICTIQWCCKIGAWVGLPPSILAGVAF